MTRWNCRDTAAAGSSLLKSGGAVMTHTNNAFGRGCGAATVGIVLTGLFAGGVWMGVIFVARVGDVLAAALRGASPLTL
jgi:hypothetical protein